MRLPFAFELFFLSSVALCFPSLFSSKERRRRSIRNIKAESMRLKIRDLCFGRTLAAHLHSACLLFCLYIPLRTGDMCHFASFAEGKEKRKKVSFILRQEPSQSGMPNWHHTLVLSTLSCRSCTATGLFNNLTGLSWFKKEKCKGERCVCVCVHVLASGLATCKCEKTVQELVTCLVLSKSFLMKPQHQKCVTFGEY